jgi:hypothetical protein
METMGAVGHSIPLPLGPPRPFRLMACIDLVMGDTAYDRHHFYFAWG